MSAQLKPKVAQALDPAQAVVLRHAIEELAKMRLESAARWRLMQIEHCLLEGGNLEELTDP